MYVFRYRCGGGEEIVTSTHKSRDNKRCRVDWASALPADFLQLELYATCLLTTNLTTPANDNVNGCKRNEESAHCREGVATRSGTDSGQRDCFQCQRRPLRLSSGIHLNWSDSPSSWTNAFLVHRRISRFLHSRTRCCRAIDINVEGKARVSSSSERCLCEHQPGCQGRFRNPRCARSWLL